MGYAHLEIIADQVSKIADAPCGDVLATHRTAAQTLVILADGIGSGAKARLAADLTVSRITRLIENGFSVRQAFARLVKTMEDQRRTGDVYPYAVFTLVQTRPQGTTTILSYEMPQALAITSRRAQLPPAKTRTVGSAILSESTVEMQPGDALMLMSDGITQAGIGTRFNLGWSTPGVQEYLNAQLRKGAPLDSLPQSLNRQAARHWHTAGDDCSSVLLHCRKGLSLTLFTGPPADKRQDARVVKRFLETDGIKIVCGGSTAGIVAKHLNQTVTVNDDPHTPFSPAHYHIDAIDLVTEGAVTLNQVVNIFDHDPDLIIDKSGVAQLNTLLHLADRVTIYQGTAANPALTDDLTFRRQGILDRRHIIPLLIDKLTQAGKLVILEHV